MLEDAARSSGSVTEVERGEYRAKRIGLKASGGVRSGIQRNVPVLVQPQSLFFASSSPPTQVPANRRARELRGQANASKRMRLVSLRRASPQPFSPGKPSFSPHSRARTEVRLSAPAEYPHFLRSAHSLASPNPPLYPPHHSRLLSGFRRDLQERALRVGSLFVRRWRMRGARGRSEVTEVSFVPCEMPEMLIACAEPSADPPETPGE